MGNPTSESNPTAFHLYQNHPNPFNPLTIINYSLREDGHITLAIYDILGRKVSTLIDERKSAGNHSVEFNASNLPSGVYVYKLISGNYTASKKLILLR